MKALELINRVKYSRTLYSLYYHICSSFLRLAKFFVRTDDNLIVFVSFGGKKFDDSPRCIYEGLLKDARFDDYRLVWAFVNPCDYVIPRGEIIRIDTFKYFRTLLRARCWVTNSGVERGLSFSGKHTFYLNTWHGTALKKMGMDVQARTKSFRSKAKSSKVDIMLAQGQYDVDLFSRVFRIVPEKFMITGLPRNDELVKDNHPSVILSIRHKLGISSDKKVVLYAPTFREYTKDSHSNVIHSVPFSFSKLQDALGEECILLVRAHYEVIKLIGVKESPFVRNVSSYPNLNELMLVSDLLVSDYSSIFFDYSILGRPMICYAYDYQEYQDKRGMYFDIREELHSYVEDEDTMIEEIKKALASPDAYVSNVDMFRSKYVTEYGYATEKTLDIIYDSIAN
ncbi:MAG: CDP-glycerol glycerophosphotransferase family protein [Bacteroidales bacterium]|nr:CDP-glycerol glycerophosphotransferase family protein [Bacteroidales bacterium]